MSSKDDGEEGDEQVPLTPEEEMQMLRFKVKEMEDKFPILFNYIDSRNKLHLTWLKWCGFKIIKERYIDNVKFYEFIRIKKYV